MLKKKTHHKIETKREAIEMMGEYTSQSIAEHYGISRSTLYVWRDRVAKADKEK